MNIKIKWKNHNGFVLHENGNVAYLTVSAFDQEDWLTNAFSTRLGGISKGYLASMNLGFNRGDDPETVRENYRIFARATGLHVEDMVLSKQTHTTNVRRVTKEDRGRGITRPVGWDDVDGLVTNEPGCILVTVFADCVPLYFVDPVHHAIGLSHSGWRGTAARMGQVTIERMHKEFGTDPVDLLAAIGPSICEDCYEVSEEVAEQFPEKFSRRKPDGKYMLNLQAANRQIMEDAGVPREQITMPGICTCCNPDLLFSHRASHGKRGLCAAFLGIRSM